LFVGKLTKIENGTNCLDNFGRPEHLAAGQSSLIHRKRESNAKLGKSRIWMGNQCDRWNELRSVLRVKTNTEVGENSFGLVTVGQRFIK
jgi:hypothetical protein